MVSACSATVLSLVLLATMFSTMEVQKPASAEDWMCTAMVRSENGSFASISCHIATAVGRFSMRNPASSRSKASTTFGAPKQ